MNEQTVETLVMRAFKAVGAEGLAIGKNGAWHWYMSVNETGGTLWRLKRTVLSVANKRRETWIVYRGVSAEQIDAIGSGTLDEAVRVLALDVARAKIEVALASFAVTPSSGSPTLDAVEVFGAFLEGCANG